MKRRLAILTIALGALTVTACQPGGYLPCGAVCRTTPPCRICRPFHKEPVVPKVTVKP